MKWTANKVSTLYQVLVTIRKKTKQANETKRVQGGYFDRMLRVWGHSINNTLKFYFT